MWSPRSSSWTSCATERARLWTGGHGPCALVNDLRLRRVRQSGRDGGVIRLGELPIHLSHVVRPLDQVAGAPLTSRFVHEIAAVDVDRGGKSIEGVHHRVDRLGSEHRHVTCLETLPVRADELVAVATEELVVLCTEV